ncbi:enoyl-CoA hydratase/isomerase family protein [Nocardioides panacisoli]|uniref:enoyl-CoA hydratase-related protein n=1 Tax=Nocardioides panacisoli TaxID=627624 RepID=UPI001C636771|nr:enoyl-CoA hydratase-related protein [Nocardioides panacisoli]QYJ03975.1 enoyl-CoA hydratase/isomerase family protein [Nocardioides panacisoli]
MSYDTADTDGPRASDETDVRTDDDLLIERGDGVVTVTFNRPERRNAFTTDMYKRLRDLCDELATDTSVGVLVLRGAGGAAFAAGNEISDFLSGDVVEYEQWIRELLNKLFELPQVTIAAINGVCVGGGLAVATHCDLRVATDSSRFGYPIARTLGNALSAPIVYRCATVFGESLTREMLLASRLVAAPRAHAAGALVTTVEDDDGLQEEIDSLVAGITQASKVTLRVTKEQLLTRARVIETAPDDEEALLREVYEGPDFAEGVRAFLAKETPEFGQG